MHARSLRWCGDGVALLPRARARVRVPICVHAYRALRAGMECKDLMSVYYEKHFEVRWLYGRAMGEELSGGVTVHRRMPQGGTPWAHGYTHVRAHAPPQSRKPHEGITQCAGWASWVLCVNPSHVSPPTHVCHMCIHVSV